MTRRALMMACALSAGLCSYSFGQITGKVVLDGEAPAGEAIDMSAVAQCAEQHADAVVSETYVVGDEGALANVVVSITPPDGGELKGDVPAKPAVLDQKGCQYTPHVLAMMTGQKILVTNSDPFLHNVHGFPEENPEFNKAQPNIDKKGLAVGPMKAVERFVVKCDVH